MLSHELNLISAIVIYIILSYMGYPMCKNLHLAIIPIIVINAVHSVSNTELDVMVHSDKDGTQKVSVKSDGTLNI